MPSLIDRLTRRKSVTFEDRNLSRVLNTLDLTALGIGSTVGVGFYVIAGEVARNVAGPAVTISFLIAAIASVFAGLCYAEFGARVPKAGSAYIYTYVCVGEFIAFVIGWNLILEYVIGTASVATGFSGYIDQIAGNRISTALSDAMPLNVSFLSEYPDFLAFGLTLALTLVLCLGVRESSRMNNLFTAINLLVILYVIIAAGTQANTENWSIPKIELNETCINATAPKGGWGVGGFAPYGFNGIIQGAATCFFGFVGFDVIATTGEEAIKPERTIPVSISLSLLFVFLAYLGMSTVITLALPYCLEDVNAPLVYLFQSFGWETATWIVSIGAMFGFSASLFGGMFPLPRVIFAMADDGLLFRILSSINRVTHTPVIATFLSGLLAGLMALFFDLSALVDMMSIGTLMAYGIVALSVMLLRYTDLEVSSWKSEYTLLNNLYAADDDTEPEVPSKSQCNPPSLRNSLNSPKAFFLKIFNVEGLKDPSDLTATLVSYATLLFFFLAVLLSIVLVAASNQIAGGDGGAIAGVAILALLIIINLFAIARQPESKAKLSFKVPFVPWLPGFSAFFNMYLMCNLSSETWIRFAIWMAIGLLIYFGYGLRNSAEEKKAGGSKYGQNNPGFVGDGGQRGALIIPTIEIHPATPTNSEPNTPKVSHKTKPPLPQSPLASELGAKQIARADEGSPKRSEGQSALASLVGVKKERLESETSESYLDDNVTGEDQSSSKDCDEDGWKIPRMLPPLQASPAINDEGKQGSSDSGNCEVITSSVESLHEVSEKESSSVENEHSLIKDIEVTGEELIGVIISGPDNGMKGEDEDKEHAVEDGDSEISHSKDEDDAEGDDNVHGEDTVDQSVLRSSHSADQPVLSQSAPSHSKDEGDVEDENNEHEEDTVDQSVLSQSAPSHSKAENEVEGDDNDHEEDTVDLSVLSQSAPSHSKDEGDVEGDDTEHEEDTVDQSILRSSQSAPVLPSPPPPPPPSLAGYSYSSVPSTPVSKRHPFKILKRMSSFDDIPPSSPDSPLARRLGDKFVIIPVKERGAGSDVDGGGGTSPGVSPPAGQEALMKELVSKLGNRLGSSDQEYRDGKPPVFTVGSDDVLEGAPSNSDVLVSDLMGSATAGQSREFKKVFSKESMLEVLDTIRERGESKILFADEDRPEIKDLVPRLQDATDGLSPATDIAHKGEDAQSETGAIKEQQNDAQRDVLKLKAMFDR